MGRQIPVEGGQIHARIYKPKGATGMLPVIVYYHGGGWVIADINSYDASARGLAEKTNAILVSVHYRQAPEYKFPTAHNDAFAAYEWVLANAGSFGGDANKVALAGESAGGNLACNVSIMARDRGIKMPLHQLLVYPIADDNMNNQSYQKYANAKPLNKPLMEWFAMHYLNNMAEGSDPRISLVDANLRGLPPTTLISAQIDPLHDEGRILASRLRAAGVDVRTENYEGVTHEFFGMDALLDEARKAQLIAAYQFRKSFGTR
jgi:acetyl esterase/lipase